MKVEEGMECCRSCTVAAEVCSDQVIYCDQGQHMTWSWSHTRSVAQVYNIDHEVYIAEYWSF